MHSGYCGQIADFLADHPDSIIGRLHQTVAEDGFSRVWNTQTLAWQEELDCLQRAFRQIVATDWCSSTWTVLLEYEIARRGRRVDAIVLTNYAIIVLEFKIGLERADGAFAMASL